MRENGDPRSPPYLTGLLLSNALSSVWVRVGNGWELICHSSVCTSLKGMPEAGEMCQQVRQSLYLPCSLWGSAGCQAGSITGALAAARWSYLSRWKLPHSTSVCAITWSVSPLLTKQYIFTGTQGPRFSLQRRWVTLVFLPRVLVQMVSSSRACQKLPVIFISGIPLLYWETLKLWYLLCNCSVQCVKNWAVPVQELDLAQSSKVLFRLQIRFGNPCFIQFYRVSQTPAALDKQTCLKAHCKYNLDNNCNL